MNVRTKRINRNRKEEKKIELKLKTKLHLTTKKEFNKPNNANIISGLCLLSEQNRRKLANSNPNLGASFSTVRDRNWSIITAPKERAVCCQAKHIYCIE